jgi:acetylornithine deacetylase/succinyl-diaminopimelate desuccinylase-like protein
MQTAHDRPQRRWPHAALATCACLALVLPASAAPAADEHAAFRALYRELVETNTTASQGDCTLAAARMAAHLKAAGFSEAQLHRFVAPGHPREGGLVAVWPGHDPKARPMLLLAHLDVVEARREDWVRDPFTLVEEGGYFYARGSSDDKAQAAIWVDTLVRFAQEKYAPRRTVKLALTCGEETTGAFNGAQYLAAGQRGLIDAAFALNEGGGGRQDDAGKPQWLNLQVGEKLSQDYQLEVTNAGGHSSMPVKDNAITRLAAGLVRLGEYEFPVQLTDTTRAYFTQLAGLVGGEQAAAITALLRNPGDAAAEAIVSRDASWHSMLRTTCVATMLAGGHAVNALPQRATANVNCRIFPGTSPEQVRATLQQVVADEQLKVTAKPARNAPSPAIPLDPLIVQPAIALAAVLFPGVPLIPFMQTGATDGAFLTPVGIPTYGVPGVLGDADSGHVHGLNERIRVQSLYRGRDYLYRLVKAYAEAAH